MDKRTEILSNKKVTFGVPTSFFDPFVGDPLGEPYADIQPGKSGREIECAKIPKLITINDVLNPDLQISAVVDSKGTLKVSINIIDEQGQKHPDMEPRELLVRSINFLIDSGNDIHAFQSAWALKGEYTTNTNSFVRDLRNNGILLEEISEITEQDPRWNILLDAARNTWTGEMMEKIGLKKIESFSVEKFGSTNFIHVLFSSPDGEPLRHIETNTSRLSDVPPFIPRSYPRGE
jgi:hypothetical protein